MALGMGAILGLAAGAAKKIADEAKKNNNGGAKGSSKGSSNATNSVSSNYGNSSNRGSKTDNSNSTGNTGNRYNTTVYAPNGQAQQGYIENGKTYLLNGSRLPDGYTSIDSKGRKWVMQNGQGVRANNESGSPTPAAYTKKFRTGTYAGNRYVTSDGLNIDMDRDYSAEIAKTTDPAERRILEEYRNAKTRIMQAAGITDYDPTYDYSDVDIADTLSLQQAQQEWEREQNRARDAEIRAARQGANAELAELAQYRKQLEDSHADEIRQAWINSQLSGLGLAESLAARGLTGGLAETAALDLDSAYQSKYANLERLYGKNLADIASNEALINSNLGTTINSIRNSYGASAADSYRSYLTQKAERESAARADIIRRLGL